MPQALDESNFLNFILYKFLMFNINFVLQTIVQTMYKIKYKVYSVPSQVAVHSKLFLSILSKSSILLTL